MAGFLDDFGIDTEAIPDAPSNEIDDGFYEYEISNAFIKEGSKAKPDHKWLIIEYLLDNGKKYGELFNWPKDVEDITDYEKDRLSWYITRLKSLGFEPPFGKVGVEELVGLTGSLNLVTKPGKSGGEFQNISKLRSDGPTVVVHEEEAPIVKKAPKAAAPATAKKNPFGGE